MALRGFQAPIGLMLPFTALQAGRKAERRLSLPQHPACRLARQPTALDETFMCVSAISAHSRQNQAFSLLSRRAQAFTVPCNALLRLSFTFQGAVGLTISFKWSIGLSLAFNGTIRLPCRLKVQVLRLHVTMIHQPSGLIASLLSVQILRPVVNGTRFISCHFLQLFTHPAFFVCCFYIKMMMFTCRLNLDLCTRE